MVFIRRWEVLTCGSPTIRTSNSGRSSPRLANDLWFTHLLNVQQWEVFASACDLWFTHALNAFVNTNTVTRGSTARATHRAVPLPKQEESTEGAGILRMRPSGDQGEGKLGGARRADPHGEQP